MTGKNLYQVAKEYIDLLDLIEKTSNRKESEVLEEKRVILHGLVMDALSEQGIVFKDREHATRIAMRIAKQEL